MAEYTRYGVYIVPDGPLYELGASWLGWDSVTGRSRPHPDLEGIGDAVAHLTKRPRKYGFHGTLRAPFALADGIHVDALEQALVDLCRRHTPIIIPELEVRRLGAFLAIVPVQSNSSLSKLAADVVASLDPFRAPLSEAELAKRRRANLTNIQEDLLARWGYPYVMEEFRFHMTLTGPSKDAEMILPDLAHYFAQPLGRPFSVETLSLVGEVKDGNFRVVRQHTLTG